MNETQTKYTLDELADALRNEFDGFDEKSYEGDKETPERVKSHSEEGRGYDFCLSVSGIDIHVCCYKDSKEIDEIKFITPCSWGNNEYEPIENYQEGTIFGDVARKIAHEEGVSFGICDSAESYDVEKDVEMQVMHYRKTVSYDETYSIPEIVQNVRSVKKSQERLDKAIQKYDSVSKHFVGILLSD